MVVKQRFNLKFQFLANKRIPVPLRPPYSLDLARWNLYLSPKVKNALKRTHYQFVEGVKEKTAKLLKKMTSDVEYVEEDKS